jgi:hypothetical protein
VLRHTPSSHGSGHVTLGEWRSLRHRAPVEIARYRSGTRELLCLVAGGQVTTHRRSTHRNGFVDQDDTSCGARTKIVKWNCLHLMCLDVRYDEPLNRRAESIRLPWIVIDELATSVNWCERLGAQYRGLGPLGAARP